MQKVYIEQETQTEIQSGTQSEESIQTKSKHSYYKGPYYLMFGPQKQLLLVSAEDLKNSENFHGIQINIHNQQNKDQKELQKQYKKTYQLSRKQPKMIDYLFKRNDYVQNSQLQLMTEKVFQQSVESPIIQENSVTQVKEQQNQQIIQLNIPLNATGYKLPILKTCSFCKQVGSTKIVYVANSKTYFYSLILCLTLPFLLFIPYFVDDCQQAISQCQSCGRREEIVDQVLIS